MASKNPVESTNWLEQAFPQMHFLLLALDGDRTGRLWLETYSPGTALLARLLGGDDTALPRMNHGGGAGLDDLFELVDNDDVGRLLEQRKPELHLLFSAVRGDEAAAKKLKRVNAAYHRPLGPLREVYERFQRNGQIGPEPFEESTAADMGCLVGEMHLKQGEFERAIEAFTRAIETQPSADLYEGRARAYRGLAEQDVERAQLIRRGR
ncbi:MAG: tetratricopeptide repeat protein [Gemmataceae bacterium]